MEPLLAESASLKVKVVDLKEHLKRLKKVKADEKTLEEIDARIRAEEKEAHDLEAQAASLDARLFLI